MSNQRVLLLITFFVARIALGVLPNLSDTILDSSFCVWTDSLWMRVAQSRMIVVASAKRMQATEYSRYQLSVQDVLKGEVNVDELFLQLHDYYDDEVNAQVLDGSGGKPIIVHLAFASDTGRIGNSSICYSIPSNFGAVEPFTFEKVAAIRAEVARQRRQLDEFSSRAKIERLPHWAEVTNLTAQLTLSPVAQQEAVTEIRSKISRFFPALIAAMDDNANLSEEFLALPNYSPARFERFRRYGPKKVVDLVATLLGEATYVPFGNLSNGASYETRRHVVNGWRILLLHWLDASGGDYNLPPLAISRITPVRDAADAKMIGSSFRADDNSSPNTNPVSLPAVKTQESHQSPAIDSNDGCEDFIF